MKAFVVVLDSRPVRCFFSRAECKAWLRLAHPKCPSTLRILRMQNGYWEDTEPEDITAKIYLEGELDGD